MAGLVTSLGRLGLTSRANQNYLHFTCLLCSFASIALVSLVVGVLMISLLYVNFSSGWVTPSYAFNRLRVLRFVNESWFRVV